MRKRNVIFICGLMALAGCGSGYGYNNPMNSAAVRTVGGAGVGAVAADAVGGSRTKGALAGALAGGLSCTGGNCH